MSTPRKGGLGRGLASLIPTGPAEGPRLGNAAADVLMGAKASEQPQKPPAAIAKDSRPSEHKDSSSEATDGQLNPSPPLPNDEIGAVYREIPPAEIRPNPRQPRAVFDEEALDELIHSIREFGLMQPIVVRELERPTSEGHRFELIMGERRWRACSAAGLATIPSIVRETADDEMLRDALLENIHRVQLNPLEEASAYQQLLDEFGVTHDELATKIGRSRPVITNMIRLLKLPIAVQRRVAAGILSAGHARALLSLTEGAEAQELLAARIVAEGLSVRATEEAVTLMNRDGINEPAPPSKRQPIDMPELKTLADRLADNLDTRVMVSMGKKKGKIVVEFGSVDDLERIVGLIAES